MNRVSPAPLVPLPLVRVAAARSWSQIYSDADLGRIGPVSRVGTRLYVGHDAALSYLARVRPDGGSSALEQILTPHVVAWAP